MIKVSDNWLHNVTGKHRDTIKKHTAHIKRDSAGKIPSDLALQALYVGEDGQLTHSEALRRLAIAREKQISQDIRLKDARVITIEEHGHILLEANAKWRAALITHCLSGELLSETSVNNIIDSALELSLREMTPEEARRIKSERALSFADRVQGHIEWLKKERARADFQTSMQCAGERLRAAYARSLADKSPAAIAALETAQADLRKIADASPLKRFTAASNGA
jgi:hypothetical protein